MSNPKNYDKRTRHKTLTPLIQESSSSSSKLGNPNSASTTNFSEIFGRRARHKTLTPLIQESSSSSSKLGNPNSASTTNFSEYLNSITRQITQPPVNPQSSSSSKLGNPESASTTKSQVIDHDELIELQRLEDRARRGFPQSDTIANTPAAITIEESYKIFQTKQKFGKREKTIISQFRLKELKEFLEKNEFEYANINEKNVIYNAGNGDCFFLALHQGLKERKLLDKYCFHIKPKLRNESYSCSTDAGFAKFMREFISQNSDEAITRLIEILKTLDSDSFKEYISTFSRQLREIFSYNNIQKLKRETNPEKMISDYKQQILHKERGEQTYVCELELAIVRESLNECGILLSVFNDYNESNSNGLPQILADLQNRICMVNIGEYHYEFISFRPGAHSSTGNQKGSLKDAVLLEIENKYHGKTCLKIVEQLLKSGTLETQKGLSEDSLLSEIENDYSGKTCSEIVRELLDSGKLEIVNSKGSKGGRKTKKKRKNHRRRTRRR